MGCRDCLVSRDAKSLRLRQKNVIGKYVYNMKGSIKQ